MVTLSIDTAANFCAAALNDTATGKLLSAVSRDIGRGHAEVLMAVINEVMEQACINYQNIDKIVTTLGPGSFTGVRVGISTARAIGLGLSRPVVGISVLQACAHHVVQINKRRFENRIVSVILNARREEFYFQPFRNGEPVQEPELVDIEQLVKFHEGFTAEEVVLCGSGASKFLEKLAQLKLFAEFPIAHHLAAAPIEFVAELGTLCPVRKTRPEPIYLRGADAKKQQGFAIARAQHDDRNTVS